MTAIAFNPARLRKRKALYARFKRTIARGPWENEPDRVEWHAEGFACLIMRNELGNLCGYVEVPPDHPWFGRSFGQIEADAHGGITYAGPGECAQNELSWLVGFDCAHYRDVVPFVEAFRKYNGIPRYEFLDQAYRDIEYVRAQVERLALQAAAAAEARAIVRAEREDAVQA